MPVNESNSDIPLTEATFLILLSLAPGPKHGYGILKDVETLSKGRIVFSTGTLYGAIKRLLELGWITRSGEDEPVGSARQQDENGRQRKEYVLTSAGCDVLNAEIARMGEMLHAAHQYFPGASLWAQ